RGLEEPTLQRGPEEPRSPDRRSPPASTPQRGLEESKAPEPRNRPSSSQLVTSPQRSATRGAPTNPLRAPFVNRPPSAPIDTLAPQRGLQESERRVHRNIANEPGLTNRAREEELTSGAPHLSASVKNHRG
ncbi:hypothetical protein T484DRAFT_1754779, partial [Baffinella frigidus]